ncbi:hypothetical protein LINPERHAP2_LOCUS40202 [Linum perenne]
MILGSSRS